MHPWKCAMAAEGGSNRRHDEGWVRRLVGRGIPGHLRGDGGRSLELAPRARRGRSNGVWTLVLSRDAEVNRFVAGGADE